MHALLAVPHVLVGGMRGIVPLIVLARARQRQPLPHGYRRGARMGSARVGPRTARSSARPSGTRPAAPARTMQRRANRNHGQRRRRPMVAQRVHQPNWSRTALSSRNDRRSARIRSRRASRWCGRSRAGRERRRGSRPPPRRGITLRHEYASSGKPCSSRTHGRPSVSNPASRMCTRSPLMSGTKRERMPAGRTVPSSGASSIIVSFGSDIILSFLAFTMVARRQCGGQQAWQLRGIVVLLHREAAMDLGSGMAGMETAERTVFLSTLPAVGATATAGALDRAGLAGHLPACRAVCPHKLR